MRFTINIELHAEFREHIQANSGIIGKVTGVFFVSFKSNDGVAMLEVRKGVDSIGRATRVRSSNVFSFSLAKPVPMARPSAKPP